MNLVYDRMVHAHIWEPTEKALADDNTPAEPDQKPNRSRVETETALIWSYLGTRNNVFRSLSKRYNEPTKKIGNRRTQKPQTCNTLLSSSLNNQKEKMAENPTVLHCNGTKKTINTGNVANQQTDSPPPFVYVWWADLPNDNWPPPRPSYDASDKF